MDAPAEIREINAADVSAAHPCWHGRWAVLSLVLIAAATRLALLSPAQGESDAARFTVAVWQWLRFGPHAAISHFTYGYYPVLAPGYFALWRWLAAWFQVSASNLSLALNTLSALVALLTAPLLYRIGARFLAPAAAWTAAALFLLAPGFWWLGLEAHPQGPALLFMLAALDQFVLFHAHRHPARGALAAVALAAALLMRGDSMLLAPAFPVLAWLSDARAADRLRTLRILPELSAVFAAAAVMFLKARALILDATVSATHRSLLATVIHFWGRSFWVKQIIPMVTAVGPAVCAFALVGLALALSRKAGARAGLLVAAAIPGFAFWLAIEGNNTRHIVDYWLLLLWAACLGWHLRKPRWLAAAAALAVAANWLLIPPNSNVSLYPSPDVLISHRFHVVRVNAIARAVTTLRTEADTTRGTVCYLGYATTPFVQQDLALSTPAPIITTFSDGWRHVHWNGGRGRPAAEAFLAPAYNRWDFLHQAVRCQHVVTIEFTPTGQRLRYFGAELDLPPSVAKFENWIRRREVAAEGWP